jgi:hypothetical protein
MATGSDPQLLTTVLTVTDTAGLETKAEVIISLNNTPPNVEISSFKDGDFYPPNGLTILPLEAEVTDAEHSSNELTYKWETFLQHNTHFHPEEPDYEPVSQTIIDPLGCGDETFWYRIRLTVTDAAGLSSVDEHEIYPYCGDPFFELLNLEGNIVAQEVVLDWATIDESQLAYFEVQRSADYRFAGIGNVDAQGNAGPQQVYRFVDAQPLVGTNYYRLKGVRDDGVYLYSNVIAIDYSMKTDLSVYPNPVQDQLTVFLHKAVAPKVSFEVYNAIGQAIFSHSWEAVVGEEFSTSLQLQSLETGIYYYRIKNGEKERVSSFLLLD